MTAPAITPLRSPATPPVREPVWGATFVALVLTGLSLLFMAEGLVVPASWAPLTSRVLSPASERVTWVETPLTPLPAAEPRVAPSAPAASGAAASPMRTPARVLPPTAVPTAPRAPAAPVLVAPPPPAGRDSAPTNRPVPGTAPALPPGAHGMRPPAIGPSAIPTNPPNRVPPPVSCEAPCAEAGAAAARTGAPLTAAEREAVLREIGASVPAMAAARRSAGQNEPVGPADPGARGLQMGVGVTLQVGLPGGGPTKAERERAAKLHGENALILSRITSRADSVARADSTARADSVARARRASQPPRRDRAP